MPEHSTEFFTALKLHDNLVRALDKLGFREPTPVQQAMLPLALAGSDLQASAATGSGKTLAYLLPVMQRMLSVPAPDTASRCLIMVPTRELADQVHKDCEALAAFSQVKSLVIYGGTSLKEQKAALRKNPEIVIGTPGRLLELLRSRALELADLEFLVLDEADRMLDMGFRDDVLQICAACREQRQSMLLSATLNHAGLGKVAQSVLTKPRLVDMGSHRSKHDDIGQQIILADDYPHKDRLTLALLGKQPEGKILVFTNTREQSQRLAAWLRYQEQQAACLHGEMTQEERQQVMKKFRGGGLRVLVATDLAARGLDIDDLDLVINYGMARSGDDYVHRIGRTGRAGRTGLAISLISPQEWNRMESIERYLKLAFERISIKGLQAKFKGPARKTGAAKIHGKAAPQDKKVKKKDARAKQRLRQRKNIGKRRKPTAAEPVVGTGLAPLRRKQ